MTNNLENEELIARYLLGELPEVQQTEIEDRAFSNREYRRQITAVENDLIDGYVRQELTATQRRRFEEQFLTSANRRQRVEFAKALATATDEAKAAEKSTERETAPKKLNWRDSLAALVYGLTPRARML